MSRMLSALAVVLVLASCSDKEPTATSNTIKNALPAFDISLLRRFETYRFEEFIRNPLRDELKVRYALALSGFWLVKRDLKTSEAYNTFAIEKARKHGMKNEEAQGVMGSAMLADASNNLPEARERITKAIVLFKEAGSKEVIYDAMFYQAKLQQRSGMHADSLKTYTKIASLAEGPRAESIKRACQTEIAGLKAGASNTSEDRTNAQFSTATNAGSRPLP